MNEFYKTKKYHALRAKSVGGYAREIGSDAQIKIPDIYKGFNHDPIDTMSIWDTGATNSMISEALCSRLGTPPVSRTKIQGINRVEEKPVHLIDVILPGGVVLLNVRVAVAKKISSAGDKYGLLIGMDIIALGDFCITAYKDNNGIDSTLFSFRIPHGPKPIDFVDEINTFIEEQKKHQRNQTAIAKFNKKMKKK